MKNKKLYFFNEKWRNYPNWVQGLAGMTPLLLVYVPVWFLESKLWLLPGALLYLFFFAAFIWSITRKNYVQWKREPYILLNINGKKLDLDLKFLSEVWIENNELNIRRINRVDSFDISHLREEYVNKLFNLLKEYEPQAV